MANEYTGEPLYRWAEGERAYFYKNPNKCFAEILRGAELEAIVADWTLKVALAYSAKLRARPPAKGDKHRGQMEQSIVADIIQGGGYKGDRVVGQITVNVEYASADEFGRDAYNQYEGSHDLRETLYENLPRL